ncbi:glycosyltransferase family 4 protein [Gillisia sp. CAL575]|uniref:glycosyltransferase family 4 protein n=1 Tax=Gillisia sp. CAL575 TaxID=985255 RepID=UPI000551877B|nr:glycosyltransferase family 4 protein [Gillisia sp. CAL575]
MNFLVVTNAPTFYKNKKYSAYAPYVNEMDIWFSKVDSVGILSPHFYPEKVFTKEFIRQDLHYFDLPFFQFNNITSYLKALILIPYTLIVFIKAFLWADHIHLRCPGNIGLIGSIVQIFFPKKPKTVKYAGNWDPNAKQPWSYRLQKKILSNPQLSKNIKVLVYGEWDKQSKNIVPFFTASFSEKDKSIVDKNYSSPYELLFVGNLNDGKRPIFAIRFIEYLLLQKIPVKLKIFGNGGLYEEIRQYLDVNNLEPFVQLMGVAKLEHLKDHYKNSDFLILPSKSEGWPKAVAEAMFFGCIPVATNVSCVDWMLDHGERGILIPPNLKEAAEIFINELNPENLRLKSFKAQKWSQQYTLERFSEEINSFL